MMVLWLGLALATETVLVPDGSDWSYWDLGTDPDPAWNTLGFDDSTWGVGPAPLGYGEFDILTEVDDGGDLFNRHITTWFRHEFNALGTAAMTGLVLQLRKDDGAIVYLNGTEIGRYNMPLGPITSSTLALVSTNGANESDPISYAIPVGGLVDGDNVVAVEMHQAGPASNDLALDLKLAGWDEAGQIVRGPYLQMNNDDGVTVRWRTEGPGDSVVWTGSAPGALNTQYIESGLHLDHEVRVSGLGADASQYYAVGTSDDGILAGDDFDHILHTSPVPGSSVPIRIWALGDAGTADLNQEMVRDAYSMWAGSLFPDLVLMLGDNAYNSGTDLEYQEAMFDIYPDFLKRVPFWSTIGNHDGYTASSITQTGPYFQIFNHPTAAEAGGLASGTEAFYSFDYGNVHIVCLDSNGSDRSATGAQLTWLDADLAATDADWVIAFWHHPAYSKGSHDSDLETQLVEMRENALPILEAYGVDVVLSGHSHSYERSRLIDQHYETSDLFDASQFKDEGDGDPVGDGTYRKPTAGLAPNEGHIYITAGSSGKISGGALDHPVMEVSTSTLGSVVLDIDGLSLTGTFIDTGGLEYDRFQITKDVTAITDIDGPRSGLEGEELAWSATAIHPDGTPVTSFTWSFGDGSPDVVAPTAQHTFPGEGDWPLTVTVQDQAGINVSRTVNITVENGPPVPDPISAPASCQEGVLATFSGSATDPGGDPLTFTWDMGDGTLLEGPAIAYAFPDDGPFTVTLTVSDDAEGSAEVETEVTCDNQAPIFVGLSHGALVELEEVEITALYTDPGRDDVVTVDWVVDGIPAPSGDSLLYVFATQGLHEIQITLTDDEGASVQTIQWITITNGPPTVDTIALPAGLTEGETGQFEVIASDPGGDPFTVTWDFGDGTTVVGASAEHNWSQDGDWTVQLTLDDGTPGGRTEPTYIVTVDNVPPTLNEVSILGVSEEGSPVALNASASDPGVDDVLSFTWTLPDTLPLSGAAASWTPQQDGLVEVWVEVVDEHLEGDIAVHWVSISNVPPTIVDGPDELHAHVATEWTFAPNVTDPGNDLVTLSISGPDHSWIDEDGVIRWVPSDAQLGQKQWFVLTATDDAGDTDSINWPVAVHPKQPTRHGAWRQIGCQHSPGVPFGGLSALWIALGFRIGRRRHRQG